jgi:hypothetical protein
MTSQSQFTFVSTQLLPTRIGIEAMAFDSTHNQIGIGSGGRCSLWRLGKKGRYAPEASLRSFC